MLTYAPVRPLNPSGQHLEQGVIGIFGYNDSARLAEEWAQTDCRGFVTKLGVTVTESAVVP